MRLRSPLVCIFSTIPDVPDLAMVPKFLTKSSFVIPIPLSRIERIFLSLSNLIWISSLAVSPSPNISLSVSERNLILSNASEALEISSLKKISLLL
nr:Uncharacterised protein [Ipomoea batatas]GMD96201.1 Uncharacterised protein [Ipomoea batatas]GMD97498.1 Uncharacterised protein [Ipomoea batatas]GMD98416.1 Uncharacterised protein [Ipomoea batatas]GME00123.1 Uncharacterised protein [Ipomoea batatas]